MLRTTRPAAVLIALLALLAVVAGLRSNASAQAPAGRTLTLTELDKGSTFTHIRNTKGASRRSNQMGDVLAFTNPIADASGKRVGKLSMGCTTTTGARNFMHSTITCAGVMALDDGDLTVQANVSLDSDTATGAVTGGTGAYANARGVVVSTRGKDTITLAG